MTEKEYRNRKAAIKIIKGAAYGIGGCSAFTIGWAGASLCQMANPAVKQSKILKTVLTIGIVAIGTPIACSLLDPWIDAINETEKRYDNEYYATEGYDGTTGEE